MVATVNVLVMPRPEILRVRSRFQGRFWGTLTDGQTWVRSAGFSAGESRGSSPRSTLRLSIVFLLRSGFACVLQQLLPKLLHLADFGVRDFVRLRIVSW